MTAQVPLISVIVVCRNPGSPLRDALNSVWSQRDVRVDLVIIDGGSTDGTVAWLEANGSRIDYWRSAVDSGVYQAMNRGVRAARGDWLLFLGADDVLAGPTVLAEVTRALAGERASVVVGETLYRDGRVYRLPAKIRPAQRNFMHHQGSFYHRSLFAQAGFDEGLRIQGDYEFNLRLWCSAVRPRALAVQVAICATGGLSDGGRWANYREEISVRHRHLRFWRCWFWDLGSIIRFARKKLLLVVAPRQPATR